MLASFMQIVVRESNICTDMYLNMFTALFLQYFISYLKLHFLFKIEKKY